VRYFAPHPSGPRHPAASASTAFLAVMHFPNNHDGNRTRRARYCQQIRRLATQYFGKHQEAIDRQARTGVLPGLHRAGCDADRTGEPRLGQTTRLTDFGEARTEAGIDRTFSLHGATSC